MPIKTIKDAQKRAEENKVAWIGFVGPDYIKAMPDGTVFEKDDYGVWVEKK